MPKQSFQTTLRNYARGEKCYRLLRHRIFLATREAEPQDAYFLGDFLRDKLLRLKKDDWTALAFDEKDWRTLDYIRTDTSRRTDTLYTDLALDYIAANSERVLKMYERQSKVGMSLIHDDGEMMQGLLDEFDDVDRQSLFMFRAVSAQYSYSTSALEHYFQRNLKTDWLRKRFLYPLIYHAVNAPVEVQLENFLSYILTGKERDSEKATLKFLLRDDVARQERIGFKAYVGLLCHPYDACEFLLNHIELILSTELKLSPHLTSTLVKLSGLVPSARVVTLCTIALGTGPKFAHRASPRQLVGVHGFDEGLADFLCRYVSVDKDWSFTPDDKTPKPITVLARLRAQRYPIPDDFDYLTALSRTWWFCGGGRLLSCLLTSIYMVARKEQPLEIRDLLRLFGFFGDVIPFFLTAPSGTVWLESRFAHLRGDTSPAETEASTDTLVEAPSDYQDRMWIKSVQWELRDAERKVQLTRWMQTIRQEIRVAPAFLTGIDWSWLDAIIRKVRLRPFVGSSSAAYVLLLQKIEERDRRSEALRIVMEPFVKGKTVEQSVEWLISEYGQEAIAFVRFLLDPNTILLLGLAPNEIAALAARIYALQRCTREFGYTELLPQTLFIQEWETLNSTLLLMSVNGGQFEIPWRVFEKDTAAKQHDLYTTAHTLQPAADTSPLLNEAKLTLPYKYRNGKVVIYRYQNKHAPLAALVISTVEDFLEHPGFGLEVILSTRFRHDTMRREFANVMTRLAQTSIPPVPQSQRRSIIGDLEKPFLDEIDLWLRTYMHTNRPDRPEGLFDLIPSSEELNLLIAKLDPSQGLEVIISEVALWLRAKLELQLPKAKAMFLEQVTRAFVERIASERNRLCYLQCYRSTDVERVLTAVDASLRRRVEELGDWFAVQSGRSRPPLTFFDLKMAADGLFEGVKQVSRYHSYFSNGLGSERRIDSDHVRLCFDMLREIFASAIKHSTPHAARVRISPIDTEHGSGFRFSNLATCGTVSDREIGGHPYISLDERISREGDSGLAKIASLAASILGRRTIVRVHGRMHSFHVEVPFWPSSEG